MLLVWTHYGVHVRNRTGQHCCWIVADVGALSLSEQAAERGSLSLLSRN